jgi:hypothetical protein
MSPPDRDAPPWSETLSEWFGCVGVGLIPLLTNLAVAVVIEEPGIRAILLSLGAFLGEIFCGVSSPPPPASSFTSVNITSFEF